MSLLELALDRTLYLLPDRSFVADALVPCLREAAACDCMMGFFSSSALRELAPGLAEFIARPYARLRLVISPHLSPEDRQAIEAGSREPADVLLGALAAEYGKANVDMDALTRHTLRCLAYLIACSRVEIKVGLVSGGLFHLKVWMLDDGESRVAIHGSSNLTGSGLARNVEQMMVARSWAGTEAEAVIAGFESFFDTLWGEPDEGDVRVYPLHQAVRDGILRDYHDPTPPSVDDYLAACGGVDSGQAPGTEGRRVEMQRRRGFEIPSDLNYQEGDYAFQGAAVKAWLGARGRGVLEMATGSGKTITSLVAAQKVFEASDDRLLLVVAAPYRPLVAQWSRETRAFGLQAILPGEAHDRAAKLDAVREAVRSLSYRASASECLVVTHDLLCDPSFTSILASCDCPRMLIADEVHGLGTGRFLSAPPDLFEYRLGLSATPVRQYDAEGTASLLTFFGGVVFRFPLEEAIGKCLVPYDYHLHPVPFSSDEYERFVELSRRLAANGWRFEKENGESDHAIDALLRERRLVVEQAQFKLEVFRGAICAENLPHLRHTLVYASDKGRAQLHSVNALLMDDLRLKVHQVTEQETSQGVLAQSILDNFASGHSIQVLTAMRVLDEGVDIPEVERAYLLASTTVERQWIQRRGRVLRRCPRIGKTKAYVHDFVVVPPDGVDSAADRSALQPLLRGELTRAGEFAKLAANAGAPGGPVNLLTGLIKRWT